MEAEFLDSRGRRITVPVARLAGEALEERDAVHRPVAYRGRRSVVTWWWAATTGRLVPCVGRERQLAVMGMDFDREMEAFSGSSVRFSWERAGGERRLVADFVARAADGERLLVSCSHGPGSLPDETDAVLRDVCAQAGWRLLVPRPMPAVRAANLRRVSQFRHPRHWDAMSAGALAAAFAAPRPLREGVRASGLPVASALARAYHLLWTQQLTFDWRTPLLPSSIVSAAGAVR